MTRLSSQVEPPLMGGGSLRLLTVREQAELLAGVGLSTESCELMADSSHEAEAAS